MKRFAIALMMVAGFAQASESSDVVKLSQDTLLSGSEVVTFYNKLTDQVCTYVAVRDGVSMSCTDLDKLPRDKVQLIQNIAELNQSETDAQ